MEGLCYKEKTLKTILCRLVFLVMALLLPTHFVIAEGNGQIGAIEGVPTLSLSEAEKLMGKSDVYVFDINSAKDRQNNGYIPKSISINAENWESQLPKDKNATLIFYGLNRFGYQASQIAGLAIQKGYKNSYAMLDGIEAWITSGRAVEKAEIVKWEEAKQILDFKDTIHSRLTFEAIPACRDCHAGDNKGIKVTTAATKELITQKCSECHKKAREHFDKSVHSLDYVDKEKKREQILKELEDSKNEGKQPIQAPTQSLHCGDVVEKNTKEKPLCNDCHSVHITPTFSGIYSQKQVAGEKCAECHKEKEKSFHHTFHGKGMALSTPGETPSVATCFDCHGKHNILPSKDRNSTLSMINRVDTCKSCHPNANQNFSDWIAHADYTKKDGGNAALFYMYIFMTCLVVGVFLFFGAHTFLWSIRLIAFRLKHPKEWKEAQKIMHSDKVKIRRFSTLHRIQHFFMASSFLGLSFSGLPQKFYDSAWAKTMIDWMGGDITNATRIHHISAIIMFAVFFSHLAEIFILNWKRRDSVRNPQTGKIEIKRVLKALFGPDSLMPNMQDLRDMKAHFKWFFGKGPRPQFDRWTYWEKFDYLAVFWGMFVIGLSGLVLWFPTFFATFLPGWAINAATLVHSDEALLATGFIFAIHFFNTHFRADRFPMDTVIFSGIVSEEEVKYERRQWYDRLKESGKLEQLYDKDSKFASYKWLAKTAGFIMLFLGLTFLFLMIYDFIEKIF